MLVVEVVMLESQEDVVSVLVNIDEQFVLELLKFDRVTLVTAKQALLRSFTTVSEESFDTASVFLVVG